MFCVGTMSSKTGWETKSVENAMYLHFYYWFISRENQSKTISQVPSFYKLWKDYGEKPDDMISNTKLFLTKYMQELFPNVNVDVKTTNVNGTISLYNLNVNVRVTVGDVGYSLSKIVEVRPDAFLLLDKHRLG